MKLNLPYFDLLAKRQNILIAGMGGGFDVFCGLPLYLELKEQGHNVHLSNFSFSDIIGYQDGVQLTPTLKGVAGPPAHQYLYFPELYLSQWLAKTFSEESKIWCFQKTGTTPLVENYRILCEYLHIDAVILVDGGVDSLVKGDEPATGTLIEDATSLFAVNELQNVPTKIVCCVGLGAEMELSYYHIFENIAVLTAAGGFIGSCSLSPGMPSFKLYQEALAYTQGMPFQDPSVINSSIVSAVQGHYGNWHMTRKTEGSSLWISPLMGIYWFFDLLTVARHNLYLPCLRDTQTFLDAMMAYLTAFADRPRRPHYRIPLP